MFERLNGIGSAPISWDFSINVWPAVLDRAHVEQIKSTVRSIIANFANFAEMRRLVKEAAFSIGPQLPPGHGGEDDTGEFSVEGQEGEVQAFLDKQLKDRGERGVLYIR